MRIIKSNIKFKNMNAFSPILICLIKYLITEIQYYIPVFSQKIYFYSATCDLSADLSLPLVMKFWTVLGKV